MATASIGLEDFAALVARLQIGIPRAQALEAAQLSEASWCKVQHNWMTRMARLCRRGNLRLHQRYLELLELHLREARLECLAMARQLDGPLPEPPSPRRLGRARQAMGRLEEMGAPSEAVGSWMPPKTVIGKAPASRRQASKPVFAMEAVPALAPVALPFVGAARASMRRATRAKRDIPAALPFGQSRPLSDASAVVRPADPKLGETAEMPESSAFKRAGATELAVPGATAVGRQDPLAETLDVSSPLVASLSLPFMRGPRGAGVRMARPQEGPRALPFDSAAPALNAPLTSSEVSSALPFNAPAKGAAPGRRDARQLAGGAPAPPLTASQPLSATRHRDSVLQVPLPPPPAAQQNMMATVAFDPGAFALAGAGSTLGLPVMPVIGDVVPFHKAGAVELDVNAREPRAGHPPAATMMLSAFQEGAVGEPRLTLEQFARLHAEVAQAPADKAAIEARHGLDGQTHEREQFAWLGRFREQPQLVARFERLVERYQRAFQHDVQP